MRLCTAEQLFSFFHLITSQRNSLAFFPRVPIVRTKQRNKVSRPSERSVSFFFFLALLKIWRIGFPKSIPVFVFFCSTSNSSQQNKPLFFARDWELSCLIDWSPQPRRPLTSLPTIFFSQGDICMAAAERPPEILQDPRFTSPGNKEG